MFRGSVHGSGSCLQKQENQNRTDTDSVCPTWPTCRLFHSAGQFCAVPLGTFVHHEGEPVKPMLNALVFAPILWSLSLLLYLILRNSFRKQVGGKR